MKTCSKCSQEYGDDKKYCLRCGISLDLDFGADAELICAECGTSNWSDFNFCKKCGENLTTTDNATIAVDTADTDKREVLSDVGQTGIPEAGSIKQHAAVCHDIQPPTFDTATTGNHSMDHTSSEGIKSPITFLDSLKMLLNGTGYERLGEPHIFIKEISNALEVNGNLYPVLKAELEEVLNEMTLGKQYGAIESVIYQNAARALVSISPQFIEQTWDDGATLVLNNAYELHIEDHLTEMGSAAKTIWSGFFYLCGVMGIIHELLTSAIMVEGLNKTPIDTCINDIRRSHMLLPNEPGISEALDTAERIRTLLLTRANSLSVKSWESHSTKCNKSEEKSPAGNKSVGKMIFVSCVIFFLLIASVFFLKVYMSTPADQVGNEAVQKTPKVQPREPIATLSPVEQYNLVPQPLVEQAREQRPTATMEQPAKPTASKKQTTAKQQSAPPEITRDREPLKQERRSFAPHSRDDL